jgi:hypothetical protein
MPPFTDDDDVAANVPVTATPSLSSEEVPLSSDEENEGSASDSEPEEDSDGDDSNSEIADIDNLEVFISLYIRHKNLTNFELLGAILIYIFFLK